MPVPRDSAERAPTGSLGNGHRNGSENERDCVKRMVLSFLSLKRSNVTIIFDHEKLLSDLNNTLSCCFHRLILEKLASL